MSVTADVAAAVVAELNDVGGTRWRLVGPLAGGSQSGAWSLASAEGEPAVLKVATTSDWARQVLRAERAVTRVRSAGYPTPAWLACGTTSDGGGYAVQERVPGGTGEAVDLRSAAALVEILETQAGLDPDPERCWSDHLTGLLRDGVDPATDVVATTGAGGERLARTCARIVSDGAGVRFPRTDMVHGDFRPANVLFDGDRVSGVVDIEAIGSGSRAFDYATLLTVGQIDPVALELLVQAGADVAGAAALRTCLALACLDLARFRLARSTADVRAPDERTPDGHLDELADRLDEVDRMLGVR